jgi:hypothetical protein
MKTRATVDDVDRRKRPRRNLSWWGYLLTLASIFLVLLAATAIIYS